MNRVTLRMKKYSLSLRYASFYSLAVINETRKQNKANVSYNNLIIQMNVCVHYYIVYKYNY